MKFWRLRQNRKLHTTDLLCNKPWKVIKTNNLLNLDFCQCWLNLKIVNLAKKKNLNDNPQKWRKPRNFVKYNEKSEILRIIWNTLGLEHTKIISNYWSLLPTLRKVWIFIMKLLITCPGKLIPNFNIFFVNLCTYLCIEKEE